VTLHLIATCALGLEEVLEAELAGIDAGERQIQRGAVSFHGDWRDCWRANWRLRTANRILVELGCWTAADGDALAAGAEALITGRLRAAAGVDLGALLDPSASFAIRATTGGSALRDARWVALRVKDGLVDGQRRRWGRRASIDRQRPDRALRVWLHGEQASLLLDTSGLSLDHRGYRVETSVAPLREQLAAACVLVSGWDGQGPVVDPMCGSGTLLVEAAAVALGRPPGHLRRGWAFETLPGFDAAAFAAVRREPIPAPGPGVRLFGVDRSPAALAAARRNLDQAGLSDRASLHRDDAFAWAPPAESGLLLINPPYGERLAEDGGAWRRLGDRLKQAYRGWRAVVIAGDPRRGKDIGLRPARRWPVKNGPLDARILVFELY